MATRRTQLEYRYVPQHSIIGIFSHLNGYRLAWRMNQHLGFELKLLPVFTWKPQGSENEFECSLFSYYHPERFLQVYLLGNRTANGILIREPRNLDYLLLVKNSGPHIRMPEIIKEVRSLSDVQMAAWIQQTPDKATLALLFDLEVFLEELEGADLQK